MHKIKNSVLLRIIYSVSLNVAVLLTALFLYIPFFEENDDTHISMIAEGAYGKRDYHLIYANVILGKIYGFLYGIMSNIRWHTVLQYAFIFMGYILVTYAVSKHKNGVLISLAAVVGTFYELYVSLQYTKTASFIVAAGVILLLEAVRNVKERQKTEAAISNGPQKTYKKENVVFITFGVIFILYGVMLRPESCMIACIPMFFAGLLELYRNKLLVRYLVLFVPVGIIAVLLLFINSQVYSKDAKWAEFNRYNKARMVLVDYRYDILYYPDNGEKLEEIDVSENDALLIVTFQFADNNIFSTEAMEHIADVFGKKPFKFKEFRMMWGRIREELARMSPETAVLFLFIILLISRIITERSRSNSDSIKDSGAMLLSMFGMGAICAAALIYYQYSGRWSHRLIGALFIPTIFAIGYMINEDIDEETSRDIVFGGNYKNKSVIILLITLLITIGFNVTSYMSNINRYRDNLDSYKKGKEFLEMVSENKDTLYVFDTFTFQYNFMYDVFKPNKEGELKNFTSCGSWFINSPITESQYGDFGYSNSYDAIRNGSGNVVLVDNFYPKEKALFLTNHYDKLYEAVKIDEINGFNIYVME